MITAGITAAIAALLSLFGIKPGAYLVGVAIAVKVVVVFAGVVLGARMMRRRRVAAAIEQAAAPSVAPPDGGITKTPLVRERAEKE